MREAIAMLLTAITSIFKAMTTFAEATNDVAQSTRNLTKSMEVQSRTLIPSDEQLQADETIAKLQRDLVIVEQLNKLKAKIGDDPISSKAIDDKIAAIKAANKSK